MMKIVIKESTKIPYSLVDLDKVKSNYTFTFFNERNCLNCEHLNTRPNKCSGCQNYHGTYYLYRILKNKVSGKKSVCLPNFRRSILNTCLLSSDILIEDKRSKSKMKYSPSFTGELYDYQKEALLALVKQKFGILISKPRTGKTVIAAALILKLRMKTLILTHQDDLLNQFLETFSNKDNDFTDIPDIEKFEGVRIIGLCKTIEDFDKYDICLSTYRMFISESGKSRLAKVKNKFGLLLVDEVHKAGAPEYLKVISKINSYHIFGLTATLERKDLKHSVLPFYFGGVTHETIVEVLKPKILVEETFIASKREFSSWTYILRFLEQQKSRNELILDKVDEDLANGRSILIPTSFKSHVTFLVEEINKRHGENTAMPFIGKIQGKSRRELTLKARNYEVKVIVAIRVLLLGINIPRWDTIYEIMPSSNQPNFTQEITRICTPFKDKKPPIIRYFVDEMGASYACFKICHPVLNTVGIYGKGQEQKAIKYIGKQKFYSSDPK